MAQDVMSVSVVTNDNPLVWVPKAKWMPEGSTILETMPKDVRAICRVDGVYVSREYWHCNLRHGQVVEWIKLDDDSDFLRPVLQIALTIATIWIGITNPWLALAVNIVGNLAINALLPLNTQLPNSGQQASPTYSTRLSGNLEALNSPIPRICGRHQIYPNFASKPYMEFKNDDNPDGDQYYYALFAIGYGEHDIESALIDDSKISVFQDVLVSQYLAPGQQPSVVKANVVTSVEVAGNELKTLKPVGGYTVCGPIFTASSIGIDISAPRGFDTRSASWTVQYQQINQFGSPLGPWTDLASETTATLTTVTNQRWSYKYLLPSPMRVSIRVFRTDAEVTTPGAQHAIEWIGLRAYLSDPAPLNAHTSHYEVVMRASANLNQLTQARFSLIVKAKTRGWTPASGWSAGVGHTRNGAWYLADLWSNKIWGEGLDDVRIDLQSIYDLSLTADARYDKFDYVFDATMDAWEAAQLIARTMRASCFRRGGVYSVVRDELATVPKTAFSPRNTVAGSMTYSEKLPTKNDPDGVIVEYYDNRQWDWLPVECPCPGVPVITKPVIVRIPGITGLVHAEREGLFEAAKLLHRTRTVTGLTEMQGMLPSVLTPVKWQPELVGYGQTGDVIAWDVGTLTATLSEPPVFSGSETNYVCFIRDDGTLTDPVTPTAGADAYSIVLPAEPDFEFVTDDGSRERPKFIFGTATTQAELVKIIDVSDGDKTERGTQLYRLTGFIDNSIVHTVDAHLVGLATDPDDIPYTAPPGTDDPVTSDYLSVALSSRYISVADTGGLAVTIHLKLDNTGSLKYTYDSAGTTYFAIPNEWLVAGPWTPTETGDFEVMATLVSGTVDSGTIGSWEALDTDRIWTAGITGIYPDTNRSTVINLQIRDVATSTVQVSANMTLTSSSFFISGGGGA